MNEQVLADSANSDFEFPPKPSQEVSVKSNKSFLSVVLFIAAAYFVLDWGIHQIALIIVVLFIHELGHFFAMRIFNYKNLGIFFLPFLGAVATGEKVQVSQRQQVIIYLAGPLPGVFIGVVLFLIGSRINNDILLVAANMFIGLNLFNLIPVYPFDGGKILKTLFFESNQVISFVFLGLSAIGVAFIAYITETYVMFLIPIFLAMQAVTQFQVKKVKEAIVKKGLNLNNSFEQLSNRDYWLIREAIGQHMKYYARIIKPKVYEVHEKESQILKQVKAMLLETSVADLGWLQKVFVVFVWFLAFLTPVVVITMGYLMSGKYQF